MTTFLRLAFAAAVWVGAPVAALGVTATVGLFACLRRPERPRDWRSEFDALIAPLAAGRDRIVETLGEVAE